MDRRKLLESFIEAWCDRDDEEKKKQEFDFNFSVSQILALLEIDLDLDLESFANSSTSTSTASSSSSSSFQLLCTNIIPHLAATFDSGSDLKQHLQEDVLQLWKDLINIIRPMPLLDPKEPSKSSPVHHCKMNLVGW